ncbi:hypothetical protein [Xanthobacter sp. KR7-225]|uniref:hypothetical protein n=1 Tax=Xanthobacter sp. KR7-225 TaxID=3156613 RepID=UPI0032B310FC
MRVSTPSNLEATTDVIPGVDRDVAQDLTRKARWRGLALVPPAFGGSAFAALALAAGLSALPAAPAAAQGFEGDFLKNTLQMLGLTEEEEKPDIDYRERAPLVVPPTTPESLPPPTTSAAAANPNWPKDPDLAHQRARAAAAKAPVVRDDPGQPLMPSELNKGRRKTAPNYAASNDPVATGTKRDEVMPSELGFKGWAGIGSSDPGKEKPLTFNGEPERESLVQPPPGYQTPAPNAPYGVVEKKKEEFKIPNFFDLHSN